MPFQRRYNEPTDDFVIDRNLTSNPKVTVHTGTVKAVDGSIVADSTTLAIPPATPIQVNLPSPFEPVVDLRTGKISASWWKFLNELYLRTGGINDNVNGIPTTVLGAGATVALAFTGAAPVVNITHNKIPATASLSFTGNIPTVV